jgi:hypothetical protein
VYLTVHTILADTLPVDTHVKESFFPFGFGQGCDEELSAPSARKFLVLKTLLLLGGERFTQADFGHPHARVIFGNWPIDPSGVGP